MNDKEIQELEKSLIRTDETEFIDNLPAVRKKAEEEVPDLFKQSAQVLHPFVNDGSVLWRGLKLMGMNITVFLMPQFMMAAVFSILSFTGITMTFVQLMELYFNLMAMFTIAYLYFGYRTVVEYNKITERNRKEQR